MFNNNSYNFGVSKKAKIFEIATDKFIKKIKIEIEQEVNENASFVGSGIASGGRNISVYTYDDVSALEPYLFQLEIDGVRFIITSKQKILLQKFKRYQIRSPKIQYLLTLE